MSTVVTTAVTPAVTPPKSVKRVKIGRCVGCGEEKRIQARGSCAACYMARRRAGVAQIERLTAAVDAIEEHADYARQARQVLEQGLPEAAKLLQRAARVAAEKGDHRGALAILEGLPVGEGGADRVLKPLPKVAQATGAEGVRVFIGFGLGGAPLTAAADQRQDLPVVQVHPAEPVDS